MTASLEKMKSNFGDERYAPRMTDVSLIDFKTEKEIQKVSKDKHNFFDNDIASQASASIMVAPQSQGMTNRGITWNIPLLEQTYRSSPYLKRAIQWRSSNLMMKGIDINVGDNTLSSKQLSLIQQTLQTKHYRPLVKMFKYGELYGGGAVIKVVRGKTSEADFKKPFKHSYINKGEFLGLKPLTRWYMIEPALDQGLVKEVNADDGVYCAEEIGQPMYYRVNFGGGLSGFSGFNAQEIRNNGQKIQGNNVLVHRSWLYIFNPYQLGHIETQVERYWSESLMEIASRDLNRHEIIWTATAKSAVKNNLGVINIKNLDYTIRNAQTNKIIKDKIDLMKYTTNQGVIALGEKDQFQFATGNLSGNEKTLEQSMKHISLAFGTPLNILFNDMSMYDENSYLQILSGLEDVQKSEISPIMEDMIKILSKHLFGKSIGEFSFEFKPILTLTPKAKAEVINIMIEALGKAHQEGFIDTQTGIEALPDILNNPSNIFSHLNDKYINMIKKGSEEGEPITANWFKIELAKALNQFQNKEEGKGISGVESPQSSAGRVNKGGDPTKSDKIIKRHSLNPEKGKV
jgi:hypothetical protein